MKAWLKNQLNYQLTDMRGVKPEHRLVGRTFYLNSPAGLIIFKAKTDDQLTKFRDDVINPFELLRQMSVGGDVTGALVTLYAWARKNYRVSWKANLHTRVKTLLCTLNPS